ncbi:hypothetical protein HYU96_04255 [Candidatus Daviesbacteria bacterium]|nr:hypothetical protein [Candidatus Daviesbacteria bacterium]
MELEHAESDMIWEGSPVVVKNSSFPEVRGRTRAEIPTPWEIADGDLVILGSVSRMDAGE